MSKQSKYVLRCIKTNNNKFGFGYAHKKGQYVAYSGRGVQDVNKAYVYGTESDIDTDTVLFEHDKSEEHYKKIPVKVILVSKEQND